MSNGDGDLGGAAAFGRKLGEWIAKDGETLSGLECCIRDYQPYVIYRATDNWDVAETGTSFRHILAACASAFHATDYAADRVIIVWISQNQEKYTGKVCWRLEEAWAREHFQGELTSEELLERVGATKESVDVDDFYVNCTD